MISSWQTAGVQGFRRIGSSPLPIFLAEGADRAIFYAPRFAYAVPATHTAAVADLVETLAARQSPEERQPGREAPALHRDEAARLVSAAQTAEEEADLARRRPFAPECLTLFLNNSCNLKCRYCYSAPDGDNPARITPECVRAASQGVAGQCARRRLPFTVVFHGGGEPTQDPRHVDELLDVVRTVAAEQGVPLRTYLATNGVMPEERARWLARNFDRVGLSCDGPPAIQDRQRPGRDGTPTASRVARTAAVLREYGKPFHIRVTLTIETFAEQPAIVEHLIACHAPAEIRLEPVYVNPFGTDIPTRDDALRFADGFLAARHAGAALQTPVTTSLTRAGSLYGRYCNPLRQVLNLVPGNLATGCFLESRPEGMARRRVQTGRMDAETGCFVLDDDRIRSMAEPCATIPATCRNCLCAYQCTHGCPDACVLQTSPSAADAREPGDTFRCHAHRRIMGALIREAVDLAWNEPAATTPHPAGDRETLPEVAVHLERRTP